MAETLINPVSRVPGRLGVGLEVSAGKVNQARLRGTAVRGFENLLTQRDPGDLTFIAQRTCAACSVANAIAAARAVEDIWEVSIPSNGRILRNIALAASLAGNNISWFYHRALPDYLNFTALAAYTGRNRELLALRERYKKLAARGEGAPFLPQEASDYINDPDVVVALFSSALDAYRIRRLADEIIAMIAGRAPMGPGIVPGGVTTRVDSALVSGLLGRVRELSSWVREVYVPDVLALAPLLVRFKDMGVGVPNFMSFGAFPLDNEGKDLLFPTGIITGGDITIVEQLAVDRIEEHVARSWYTAETGTRHPSVGESVYDLDNPQGYSFVKAPRYDGRPVETGSLARMLVKQDQTLIELNQKLNLGPSVLGRVIARSVETDTVTVVLEDWVAELRRNQPSANPVRARRDGDGAGLVEAPGGALGHWLRIERDEVNLFQIVAGATWNASPADGADRPGPIEQALLGTGVKDPASAVDALRIVRSFDPCMFCATH